MPGAVITIIIPIEIDTAMTAITTVAVVTTGTRSA